MKNILISAAVLMSVLVGVPQAFAYRTHWDRAQWGQGHWMHDRHDGRLGWWWVVGGMWYFYPHPVAQPIIVQQAPIVMAPAQPVIVQQAPPQQVIVQQAPQAVYPPPPSAAMAPAPRVTPVMYYCKATGTYYPETMTCPNGWSTVTSGTPPAP